MYMGYPLKGETGVVRLSERTMAELRIKEGDKVKVTQGPGPSLQPPSLKAVIHGIAPPHPPLPYPPVFKVLKALSEDSDKNIIRLGEEDFEKYSFTVNTKTVVTTLTQS